MGYRLHIIPEALFVLFNVMKIVTQENVILKRRRVKYVGMKGHGIGNYGKLLIF